LDKSPLAGWPGLVAIPPRILRNIRIAIASYISRTSSPPTPSAGLDDSSRPKPAELGRGHIDYRSIFTAAKKAEVEWYYMEQEPPYSDMPALDAIKVNYDYLHALD